MAGGVQRSRAAQSLTCPLAQGQKPAAKSAFQSGSVLDCICSSKGSAGTQTKYRTIYLFSHSTKAESAGRLDRGQWPRSTLPGCSVHTAAMQPCPSSSPLSPGRSTQPRAPAAAPRRRSLSRAGRAPPPASPRAAASSSARPPCVPAHRTRTVAARQGWRGAGMQASLHRRRTAAASCSESPPGPARLDMMSRVAAPPELKFQS